MSALAVERERVVLGGDPVPVPWVARPAGRAEWAEAQMSADEPELCGECGLDGHVVTVELYPRPDPRRADTRTGLQRVCQCCAFGEPGHSEQGLLERLRAEQAEGDDHDIKVDVLGADGRWV